MSLNIFEYVNNLATAYYKQGEVIFEQGQESDGRMYFVSEGEMSVSRQIDGADYTIATLGPGAFFGEMAILNRNPRSATIRVQTKHAKLGYIDEPMFLRISRNDPVFPFSLLKLILERTAEVEDAIAETRHKLLEMKSGAGGDPYSMG
ncbi:MAG: cAMP-binding protein [Spirochaetaceae bacterium]|nr:cAMP-binding protein [Spirochaetaceae bacterium]|tara:strand:+ start:92983 stop:93426 length:444 start_codon:yes stop_codon:yes gene_type:complete